MNRLPVWRSSNPMERRGPIQPMDQHDALAWKLTRERHPQYYERKAR